MNLSNIKIIKKIGSGMLGTTYLIMLNDKKYAMKIQNILKNDRKKF